MKHWLQLFSVSALLVLQVACSSSGSSLNYRDSEITPTLEIPPDLISRSTNKNLGLPGTDIGTTQNVGRYSETGNQNIEIRTLPAFEDMKIEGEGELHWLTIEADPGKVYPLVREFWAEQGFRLIQDEPTIGVMETEWLSVKSGNDSFFSSLLETLRGAESRDQYKTRFERHAESGNTHVFLAHRGQELIIDTSEEISITTGSKQGWQLGPSDPSKEYEMLSRLMVFLGLQDDKVREELEKIGLFAARAKIEVDQDEEETYLLVKQGFTQTWNRLLHQMDRLSITVTDRDRSTYKGELAIQAKSLSSIESDREKYYISMNGSVNSNTTRIDIVNDNDIIDQTPQGKQMLQFLFQQLK